MLSSSSTSEPVPARPALRYMGSIWRGTAVVPLLQDLAPHCHFSAPELARKLGVSTRQLQRVFARVFGRPPRDWLAEQRLLRARNMLSTATRVKEVAYALGFPCVSQFSRDFRRRFGVVPSAMLGGGAGVAGPGVYLDG
jgi:AraC-like DNA-binding protein